MAAKLILSMDGAVIKEYPLNKERMTIGRKAHNDIAIDNLAVSGEHAVIVTILHDSFLEDMDSTNGLEVNGRATKKHFLQNNDVIEIGKYKLKYINDQITQTTPADFEKTMILRGPIKSSPPVVAGSQSAGTSTGGQGQAVNKPITEQAERTGKFEIPPIPAYCCTRFPECDRQASCRGASFDRPECWEGTRISKKSDYFGEARHAGRSPDASTTWLFYYSC
jgi:hypothetical protein